MSRHDAADGGAVPGSVPLQPQRHPQPDDEHSQHKAGSPEAVLQVMRARMIELEKERDDYRDKLREQAATLREQGQDLLRLRATLDPVAVTERYEQYKKQLSFRDSLINQLQKELKQLRVLHPKNRDNEEPLTAPCTEPSNAIEMSTMLHEGLDEACNRTAQGMQVGSRRGSDPKDLASLRRSAQEERSKSPNSEPVMHEEVITSMEKENMDWSPTSNFYIGAEKSIFEKATGNMLLRINKELLEKVSTTENEVLQLRDERQKLHAKLAAKGNLQNRMEADISTPKADLAELQNEKTQRAKVIASLQESIVDMTVILEKRDKGKEELQGLLRGAETKIDLLTEQEEVGAEASKKTLKQEIEKHAAERRDLEVIIASLKKEADAAAESSKAALREAETKHNKELRERYEQEQSNKRHHPSKMLDEIAGVLKRPLESSRHLLREEKASNGEELLSIEDEVKKLTETHSEALVAVLERARKTTQLEGEVDTLHRTLKIKEQEMMKFQTQLRDEMATHEEQVRNLKASWKNIEAVLKDKEEEEATLQKKFQDMEVKIESLNTMNRRYEASIREERANNKRHTETIKAKTDKLELALNAEPGETARLQTHVRNLEAEMKSFRTASQDKALARLREKRRYIKDIGKLENKTRTLSLELEVKRREETRLKNQLREAKDQIKTINTKSLNHESALKKQKARNNALEKELAELRHKVSLEKARTESFNGARKRVFELEAEARRLEKELVGAGHVRLEIQDASVRRISELESEMHRLEEQAGEQARALRTAQEEKRADLAVLERNNFELHRKVEELSDKLQLLETASLQHEDYQQAGEELLGHIRSQLSRPIEDEKMPAPDEAEIAKRVTMKGLGEMLKLKLDCLETELGWYKQNHTRHQAS